MPGGVAAADGKTLVLGAAVPSESPEESGKLVSMSGDVIKDDEPAADVGIILGRPEGIIEADSESAGIISSLPSTMDDMTDGAADGIQFGISVEEDPSLSVIAGQSSNVKNSKVVLPDATSN